MYETPVARIRNTVHTALSRGAASVRPAAPPPGIIPDGWAPSVDWREEPLPDEDAYFRGVVTEIEEMQKRFSRQEMRPVDRGFHAKRHILVRGELKVASNLPEPLQQGIFREPAVFPVWVRFSNGNSVYRADREPDIRGMAVKVLDVPGEPLTPSEPTFDLLTILQDTQPARDIKQFMAFVRASQNQRTLPLTLLKEIGFRETSRMLLWMAIHLSSTLDSVADCHYYTAVPLAWGPYAAKVSFQALDARRAPRGNLDDPDYLRRELIARLYAGPLRWNMMAQLYVSPERTPIEDSSVEWKRADSPLLRVAELTVGTENAALADDVAEQERLNRMSFSPWHAPREHRPLGSIMRARRAAYEASVRLRLANLHS